MVYLNDKMGNDIKYKTAFTVSHVNSIYEGRLNDAHRSIARPTKGKHDWKNIGVIVWKATSIFCEVHINPTMEDFFAMNHSVKELYAPLTHACVLEGHGRQCFFIWSPVIQIIYRIMCNFKSLSANTKNLVQTTQLLAAHILYDSRMRLYCKSREILWHWYK